MRRSQSRIKTAEGFGEHIPQLRRRVRGEHCASLPSRAASRPSLTDHAPPDLYGAPPVPPRLEEREIEGLRHVWFRLDVDGDGVLSPSDLFRAIRTHGLKGTSKQDAYEMLWEVSLQPEPGLTFEQFTGAYARAKNDKNGREPRRLYNYIVYSLMDSDLNGTVSADEVYTHFYSCDAEPGVVAGATWLLESMPPGEEEQVSPGLFVRYMQSGALSSVASSKLVDRPSSAPPSRLFVPPPPRITATQKYVEATAEMRRQIERRKYDSMNLCDAANLSSMELRRKRDCLVRGVTDVWGEREQERKAAINRLSEMRTVSRGQTSRRKAIPQDLAQEAVAAKVIAAAFVKAARF